MPKGDKLTTKQQRFVEVFDGDAYQAAKIAGYKGKDNALRAIGSQNLSKRAIIAAIRARESKKLKPKIATREQRQEFWTRVLTGAEIQKVVVGMGENQQVVELPPKMIDRLKASELLGRSECDFVEKRLLGFDEQTLEKILSFFDPADAEQIRIAIVGAYQADKAVGEK
jgi:phage terminase small subunit